MSSNIRLPKICLHCEGEFIAKTTVTKYCSDRCAKRAYKARKRKEKIEESKNVTMAVIEQPLTDIQVREFLSVADTCKLFNISRTTIWRLIKLEKLKTAKLGSRVIIRKEDLQKLFI